MVFRQMEKAEVRRWYHEELTEAFVESERKPLCDIMNLMDGGRYELWGLFEGAQMRGYAAILKGPDIPLVLLDYLGVNVFYRNGGLGARILTLLKAQGRPVVTEAELPVCGDDAGNPIRLRRIAFYERNGFVPAYEMATCGLRWQALLYAENRDSMEDVMAWHRALYGPQRTDVKVPIAPGETPQKPYWM